MKPSPNSAQTLQTVKREDFRSQMRKAQLERIFSFKRNIKEQVQIKSQEDQSPDEKASNQSDSDSDSEVAITRLTKMRSKPITMKYAQKLLIYVTKQKNQKNTYQLNKVYNFCQDTLITKEIREESTVPLLIAVMYSCLEFTFSDERFKEVVQILLKTFCKKPENTVVVFLEKLFLKHQIFTQFLDQSCKELGIIRHLCENDNLNYIQLNMINFLFSNIQNDQLIEAFKFLGLQQKLQKCSENPSLRNMVKKIHKITNNVQIQRFLGSNMNDL